MIVATLGGTEINRYVIRGSTKISSKIASRGTASCTLKLNPGVVYRPAKGQEVYMVDSLSGETVFAGTLFAMSRKVREYGYRYFSLVFTDFCELADRRRLRGALYDTTAGGVVHWIIDNYLAVFGVSAGTIEDGDNVEEIRFTGQKASAQLTSLADANAFVWTIDKDKKLHFVSKASYAAPWNITDAYKPIRDLEIEDSLDGYANSRTLKGSSNALTDVRTEAYNGDGVKREFAMRYKLYSAPTVKVNNVVKTVGVDAVDSGKDWYWSAGSKVIKQDASGTVLTSSDTLSVTYRGTYPLNVKVEDGDEITQHGIFESEESDSSISLISLGLDKLETLMRQNPWDKATVTYETDVPGLKAGMIQTIDLTEDEFSDEVLLTSVTAQETSMTGYPLRYTVEAVNGERMEDWLDFYRKMAETSDYEERPDETVTESKRMTATCVMSDELSVITKPQWKWGTSKWGGGDAWW